MRTRSLTVVLFVLCASLAGMSLLPSASASTLYVGGAGPGNYTSIQSAIDAASAGDTIFVYSGTYRENMKISKTLTLIGENPDTTRIDGRSNSDTIHISADGVEVTGFTIDRRWTRTYCGIRLKLAQNCHIANNRFIGDVPGICLEDSDDNIVTNNTVTENDDGWGIFLLSSRDNVFSDNTIWDHRWGITLWGGGGNTISRNIIHSIAMAAINSVYSSGNVLANNTLYDNGIAIKLARSGFETISNNTMIGSGVVVEGLMELHWDTHTIDESNLVNGKPVEYCKREKGGQIPTESGQVILGSCTDVTIEGLNISNASRAIQVANSENITVSNSTISSNTLGMYFWRSRTSTVASNVLSDNEHGILLDESHSFMISNNTASGNLVAIEARWESNTNTIADNIISDNEQAGIRLTDSRSANLTGNKMSGDGISLEGDSLEYWNTHEMDPSNTQNGSPIYYWKNTLGGTVPLGAGQVILANCSDVVVKNQSLGNSVSGIQLGYSSNITITSNSISSSGNGIYAFNSKVSKIRDNAISDNHLGIHLDDSDTNAIINNTISSHEYGVIVSRTTVHTHISRNEMSANNYSVFNEGSFSAIAYNNISGSSEVGIHLQHGDDNIVTGNAISFNELGVELLYGSRGNRIHHNNFIDNIFNACGGNFDYQWDDGAEGNYWSNYTGPDADGDGIGDTHYYIPYCPPDDPTPGDPIDRYPLMDPHEPLPSPPSEPLNLEATENQNVTLTWKWPLYDGGFPVTSFVLYRGTAPGEESYLVEIGDQLTHTDTGLNNGQVYYYRVSAKNELGEGPKSDEVRAVVGILPEAPRNLTAVAGREEIILTWSPPNLEEDDLPITHYKIYRGTEPGKEVFHSILGNVTECRDEGVVYGPTYYYRVSAKNAKGEGPKSNEVSATLPRAPGPPVNLSASPGDREVRLAWEPPIDDGGSPVTNYTLVRRTAPSGSAIVIDIGNVLTYTDTGLENGQTYYYRVRAKNMAGMGAPSDEVSATPTLPPRAPLDLVRIPGIENVTVNFTLPGSGGGIRTCEILGNQTAMSHQGRFRNVQTHRDVEWKRAHLVVTEYRPKWVASAGTLVPS